MAPTLTIDPDRLTELRARAGISSDKELAQRLHVSPATLSRIKSGARINGDFIAAAHVVLKAKLSDRLYRIK